MKEAHIASRMTARHSPLFTLESGQSGLRIYTSGRDMANLSKCSILFDESELMYFVSDPLWNKKVYLAHKKRFWLYSGGVGKRLNWLISDYRIPLTVILSLIHI